ncbi:MAG: N-acetyltransferase [Proteobacteria bacterium]|nr:N-acetyltransferase [Cystobacterineae bacterium]MCL2259506.1 N-acetyltransferase [Cystobacterineae bacterium]MCL2314026.1 N-acetyltransferase [Pseudomonadota bacterium]
MPRPRTPAYAAKALDIEVAEVHSPEGFSAFIRFPLKLYAQDANYVSPILVERREFLDSRRNPFFEHAQVAFFLARRGEHIVGRIAAGIDERYNRFHKTNTGFVGLFECIQEVGVAAALFERAGGWIKAHGAVEMLGPLSMAFHHECGLLVHGFEHPHSMYTPYNPPYYEQLFEANHFRKVKDLYSYEFSAKQGFPQKARQAAQRARQSKGIHLRRLRLEQLEVEKDSIKSIYDSMLKPGFGLLPLTQAEFDYAMHRLRPLIMARPELCFVVEADGEPVAFALSMPDAQNALRSAKGYLSRFGIPWGLLKILWGVHKLERVRVFLFGIRPGFRRRGLDALLAEETVEAAQKQGYCLGELGWIAQDDALLGRTVQFLGAKPIKTFRVFSRAV